MQNWKYIFYEIENNLKMYNISKLKILVIGP